MIIATDWTRRCTRCQATPVVLETGRCQACSLAKAFPTVYPLPDPRGDTSLRLAPWNKTGQTPLDD